MRTPKLTYQRPENGEHVTRSRLSGRLKIKNPGTLFEANDNTHTLGLSEIIITGSTADLRWITGVSTLRTGFPIARRIELSIPFAATASGNDWRRVLPKFRFFRGSAWWKWNSNGTADAGWAHASDLTIIDGALSPTPLTLAEGGTTAMAPRNTGEMPTTAHAVRVIGDDFQMRVLNGSSPMGTLSMVLDGLLVA